MSQASQVHSSGDTEKSLPWWRYPIVWMVFGGPAVVVVASLITVVIAVKHVDPVLDTAGDRAKLSAQPAVQGRNHAAEAALQPAEK